MQAMPSNCRCCDAELRYGGKLCRGCREELSSDLFDVHKIVPAISNLKDFANDDPCAQGDPRADRVLRFLSRTKENA